MSLNYDLSKVNIPLEELWDENNANTTQGMIFTTLGVGIGQLTEKNWKVFYARQALMAKLFGWEAYSPEKVKRYIGLSTNATFEDETPAKWNKRTMESALTELAWKAKQWENSEFTPKPLEDWELELMGATENSDSAMGEHNEASVD